MNQSTIELDKKRITNKYILNQIYIDFYNQFKNTVIRSGKLVEIGSGTGLIKKIIPIVITSDIFRGQEIDMVFSAEKIPFKDSSIAVFFLLNVFHHIKNPEKALKEMQRCLKIGGKIIMIEPYNSLWGGLIYKYLHHEHYDPKASWKIKEKNISHDSNLALSWIIFVRDKWLFLKKFPRLKINKFYPHTPFRYLLSGGLTQWQLCPSFLYPVVCAFEKLLSPLNKFLGMFVIIELEKIR